MSPETVKQVQKEVEELRAELAHLQKDFEEHIDSTLDEDDYTALRNYLKEKRNGKLTTHEELMKELS